MKWFLQFLFFIVQIILVILLPFVVLIRGSVWVYESFDTHTWVALAAGGGMTFLVLLIYLTVIYTALFGVKKLSKRTIKIKATLVIMLLVGYCGFTLINFNKENAKSSEVQKEFQSLHPFLRIGVGTMVLVDGDALITDMSRTHGDYKKMGLKVKARSLHYKQSDGYVHAMDLRTIGRSEVRNWFVQKYFWLMGFKTLRHDGTADHLHISLPPHDNPNAI